MIPQILKGVAWKTFTVHLGGKTNGAHLDFIKKLKGIGLIEVSSHEECDYLVCFCPIVSRAGTDISETLSKMPANKPTILVVMHQTLSTEHVVAESRRLVNHPDVHVTVDCLFKDHNFLKCNRNNAAWAEVQKHLGVSYLQVTFWKTCGRFIPVCSSWYFRWMLGGIIIAALYYYHDRIPFVYFWGKNSGDEELSPQ